MYSTLTFHEHHELKINISTDQSCTLKELPFFSLANTRIAKKKNERTQQVLVKETHTEREIVICQLKVECLRLAQLAKHYCLNALVHPFFRPYLLANCIHVAYGIMNNNKCYLLTLFIMCDKFLQYAQNVRRTQVSNGHIEWQMFEYELPERAKKISNICKLCSNFLYG